MSIKPTQQREKYIKNQFLNKISMPLIVTDICEKDTLLLRKIYHKMEPASSRVYTVVQNLLPSQITNLNTDMNSLQTSSKYDIFTYPRAMLNTNIFACTNAKIKGPSNSL